MPIGIFKPIFTFRRTQNQASSWNVFVEHLNGARADDAWRSVVDAWIDGSLLQWLERQLPDTASRVKSLGAAGETPVVKARQEQLAAALFSGSWPEGVRLAMDADEKERLRVEEEKRLAEEKRVAEEERLRGLARPGEDWTATLPGGVKLEMVWVEPGTFMMGSNNGSSDEQPVHQVTLTKGYWIGKYPFTQEQWRGSGAYKNESCCWVGERLPVEYVSWFEAVECCKRLNDLLKDKLYFDYRLALPTEAQWEFAARGGVKSRGYEYSGSNNIDEVAWYDVNSGGLTHLVGQKKPNELGIYDMSGNVWEWCHDWYDGYPSGSVTDPRGPSSGSNRVFRGGSWRINAGLCRSAYRDNNDPSYRIITLGFRVALVPVG